jgi:Fibronectin type III domain
MAIPYGNVAKLFRKMTFLYGNAAKLFGKMNIQETRKTCIWLFLKIDKVNFTNIHKCNIFDIIIDEEKLQYNSVLLKSMTMKNVALKTYRKKTQRLLYTFATIIHQHLSNDEQFISLKPDYDTLKVENDAFNVALANALRGSEAQTRIKNTCYQAVLDRLDLLVMGVNVLAKGDLEIGRASGFDVLTEPQSIDAINKPTNLEVKNNEDDTGQAFVKWKKDNTVITVCIEYQKVGETNWQNGTYSTSSSAVLMNLEAGSYYNVRIYGTGRKGLKSGPTNAVMVLVS